MNNIFIYNNTPIIILSFNNGATKEPEGSIIVEPHILAIYKNKIKIFYYY